MPASAPALLRSLRPRLRHFYCARNRSGQARNRKNLPEEDDLRTESACCQESSAWRAVRFNAELLGHQDCLSSGESSRLLSSYRTLQGRYRSTLRSLLPEPGPGVGILSSRASEPNTRGGAG